MRAALSDTPISVRNPESVRPWQHVLNPLSGYLMLVQAVHANADHAEGWNFGPTDEEARPVRWIVERLSDLWPGGLTWTADPGPHPPEARYLKLDSSKARSSLGWSPQWRLDDALENLVAWYSAYRDGEDMRSVTLGQLEAYGEAARQLAA
jgi:CDP-glucose 4,6-dehydratase